MLIHRVQLPEDNALNQATQVPNPSTTTASTNTVATDDENASQDSEAASLVTEPPVDGRTTDAADTARPGFIGFWIDYVRSDPHLKTCQFRSLSFSDSGPDADDSIRVYPIILPDCGQSTLDVVFGTSFGNGSCLFDVLVTSDRTFCSERADCGFERRVPRWDDCLPFAIRPLYVSGHKYVVSG